MTPPFDILPHLDSLRRYARVLVRHDAEADDLVQGALVRAMERAGTFRPEADLRVWLMTVLRHHVIDQRRSRRAAQARDQAWADLNPGFAEPVGEQAARLAQLRTAFLSLPRDQRESLHLIAIEGLSISETAAILDIPAGTVMSRLGRARAALRAFEDGTRRPHLKLVGGRDDPA